MAMNIQTKENEKIKLTIVYDNNIFLEGLQSDWGFAVVVEFGETKLLFDTGDNGKILLANMKKLGINPGNIDIVFLSHYHHDHTGGLNDFFELNSCVKVFYPQSFPQQLKDNIINSGAEAVAVSSFREILPDVYSLGEFGGSIPEQVLVIRSGKGIIVITGCAHPGIINILEVAKKQFPDEKIHLALGGFHLRNIAVESLNNLIQEILKMEIQYVSPTHCSGDNTIEIFKQVFDTRYIKAGVGKVFRIA
ncbi:MBL fold metallo-hydrolase [Melioribacter sp. OK-6-Me]|uniref:MBL fold metallo-hydrolase n=1 Tax=unclassified Melioribacter TaxID=2627329 RepID=UPI003ED8C3C1